ncbi:hypothetical protein SARC_03246 [Sphaeroforma arctica JP610]|uniref:Histidine kinase/HSP90-like ATPase domain-containing protein n=1 Tax=Sphaeroforma arctica JP610 TaxID=667725 RepID=A0A0L0G8H5_9EUKA|nr:hypothetical protein SARC_03246 [Sphaeroforma arctica JP610]KNC84543.1 hypothetical protein SARC_03246 [Sphaeroforma arctica JP610]|eukprot:XP_014158445.1 hypothetical protein SARC_03246 [Sphaeroforma arctica JP610]
MMNKGLLRLLLVALLALCVFASAESTEASDDSPAVESTEEAAVDAAKCHGTECVVLDGMTEEETAALLKGSETHVFEAEVNKMMKLIINSLYKNKEIFLRELISNASDAIDKIRFLALTDSDILSTDSDFKISIRADPEKGVLHIQDNGVGMSLKDLQNNLGTIAKSGTADFMEAVSKGDANSLIGQFGVGFYSAFLVADSIVVTTRKAGDEQYIWESDSSQYSITKDPREGDEHKLVRGSVVSLYLKDEEKDYLKESTLRDMVSKYSQFVSFPIMLQVQKEVEVEPEQIATEKVDGEDEDDVDVEVEVEDEDKTELPKETKTVTEYEQLNTVKPIWTRSAKEISDEEYVEFYKLGFGNTEEPLAYTHFTAEGEISFNSMLFIPKKAPQALLQQYGNAAAKIKLFVRKVFITDEMDDILPKWLSFIVGLLDSDDLPLNVSRETLQQHKLLKIMKKKLVRKALELMKNLAKADEADAADGEEDSEVKEGEINKNKYIEFWEEFGLFLKYGAMEDKANQAKIVKLLRFKSSADPERYISFEQYVQRMKPKQEKLFFITGTDIEDVTNRPVVEKLIRKGYEIIYAIEPVDEYLFQHVTEYEGKKFQDVSKPGVELEKKGKKGKAHQKELTQQYDPLTNYITKLFKEDVETVRLSELLDQSPAALVTGQMGLSGNMQRLMKAQNRGDPMMDFYMSRKPILEINPRHPIVQELLKRVEPLDSDENDPAVDETARVLLDTAALRSGYDLEDPVSFASSVEKLLRMRIDVPLSAEVDDEVEFEDDEEEEVVSDYDSNSDEDDDESMEEMMARINSMEGMEGMKMMNAEDFADAGELGDTQSEHEEL